MCNAGTSYQLNEITIPVTMAEEKNSMMRTTRKELWGWWLYDFAAGFPGSVFVPLILERLTSTGGVTKLDPSISCQDAVSAECVIPWAGGYISPTSFIYYIGSLSVLCQAVAFVSLGALADYGMNRKKMLIFSATLGSILCILMLTAHKPSLYWLAAVFGVLINICYGLSIVFFNSFLPLLVKNDPEYLDMKEEGKLEENDRDLVKKSDSISNHISTRGFALSYSSGILGLIIASGIVYIGDQSILSLNLAVAVSGVLWLIFSIFPFLFLHDRPGPNLPPGEKNYIWFSLKKIGNLVLNIRRLPTMFLYLLSYILFSDAHATIGSTAIIFGKTELKMSSNELILVAIIVPLAAVIGNYLFLFIQRKLNKTTLFMNTFLVGMFIVIPLYGVIGQYNSSVGIHYKFEMYLVASYYGLLLGAVQSFSRVQFSELIPSGMESEFFSIYEITDKGTSWLGPLLVGLINQWTGSLRNGFYALLVMLLMSIPLLLMVDPLKGKNEALSFENKKGSEEELFEEENNKYFFLTV